MTEWGLSSTPPHLFNTIKNNHKSYNINFEHHMSFLDILCLDHIFIPNKPHPNGCMFNSAADSNDVMLNLILCWRITEDVDVVLFRNTASYSSFQRMDYDIKSVISPTNQVKNVFSYTSETVVCVDSYYGSLQTVQTLTESGVLCVCKCQKSISFKNLFYISF